MSDQFAVIVLLIGAALLANYVLFKGSDEVGGPVGDDAEANSALENDDSAV